MTSNINSVRDTSARECFRHIDILEKTVMKLFGELYDPDQIVQMCREKQIQGYQNNCTSCPMVKLVKEHFEFQIAYTLGKNIGSGRWIYLETGEMFLSPYVCDKFSDNFDNGKYQDLIA